MKCSRCENCVCQQNFNQDIDLKENYINKLIDSSISHDFAKFIGKNKNLLGLFFFMFINFILTAKEVFNQLKNHSNEFLLAFLPLSPFIIKKILNNIEHIDINKGKELATKIADSITSLIKKENKIDENDNTV